MADAQSGLWGVVEVTASAKGWALARCPTHRTKALGLHALMDA